MRIHSIEDKELFLAVPLKVCESCGKKMIGYYENRRLGDLPLLQHSIVVAHYEEAVICENCVKKGGFPTNCNVCHTKKLFPQDFDFVVTEYYRDGDAEHTCICSSCCVKMPASVINILVGSDDVRDLRKERKDEPKELRNGVWVDPTPGVPPKDWEK